MQFFLAPKLYLYFTTLFLLFCASYDPREENEKNKRIQQCEIVFHPNNIFIHVMRQDKAAGDVV
jgi:hypothetical protein